MTPFTHQGDGAPEKGSALARVQERLRELGAAPREGSDTDWHCPFTDNHKNGDQNASLTVRYGDETPNKVIVACAQCRTKDNGAEFLKALGLEPADLVDRPPTKKRQTIDKTKTKIHVYVDEQGEPVRRVVKRYYENGEKAGAVQQRPNGRGGWAKSKAERPEKDGKALMYGVPRPLFRLPELLTAVAEGREIHLTEGESDADALNAWFEENDENAFATCHPEGAGKWQPEHTDTLAGAARVVVWADADGPGYACAHQRLSAVRAAGLRASARLPVAGKDVRDHLAAGHAPHDGKRIKKKALAQLAADAGKEMEAAPRGAFAEQTWDDFGNAERLVVRYADRIRWVADNEKWATYDRETGLWLPRGADQRVAGLARKTVERMADEEAGNYSAEPGTGKGKGSRRDDWRTFVRGCRSSARVAAMLTQAKTKRGLRASLNDFDANPNVLHCTNGVLDLVTFELHAHSPDWLCTISTGTDYLPGAECLLWRSYLDLFLPDAELREYVQRVVGYSLLDGNPERLFFFVCGGTSTGKSTLNEMLLAAFGGYAKPFNLSIFRANQDEKPRSDIAGVLPRRYISAVEASNEWHLHADQIKKITGGDTLAARFPWDRTDTVRTPAFVPFIFTNAIPSIEGRDRALDRRVLAIPFENEVSGKEDNRKAREQMTASPVSRAAVLAWAVEGLRKYQANGLGETPSAVVDATSGARREFSDLDRFLSDLCVFGDSVRVRPEELYEAYEGWCAANRVKDKDVLTMTKFGKGIKARGHDRKRARDDGTLQWFYEGVGLRATLRAVR